MKTIKIIQGKQLRTTWNEKEINILKNNFSTYNSKKELMDKLPNKSWNAILNMARKNLCLKKTNRWQKQRDEDAIAKDMIVNQKKSTKEVAKHLNIPISRLYKRLNNMKIAPVGKQITNKLHKLLNDTVITGYWLGFTLADGSFPCKINKKGSIGCYLSFWLSKKDYKSVKQFADYVGVTNIREQTKINAIGFTANDIETIRSLFNKIGLCFLKAKTYNPPTKLKRLPDDQLFALIVGYIDGDGCILHLGDTKQKKPRYRMTVLSHKSWMPICNIFDDFLYRYLNLERTSKASPTIKSNGYSLWSIRDRLLLEKIKYQAIKLDLPVMSRKWDKINLTTPLLP